MGHDKPSVALISPHCNGHILLYAQFILSTLHLTCSGSPFGLCYTAIYKKRGWFNFDTLLYVKAPTPGKISRLISGRKFYLEFVCEGCCLCATVSLVDVTFNEYSGNKYFADYIPFEQRGSSLQGYFHPVHY